MKYTIAKDFNFCYGHRVYTQQLDAEFSIDSACKCRHLHGHEGLIRIHLSADELTNGMVTDFKHLNWFKKWLDETLDHKFIMGVEDPLLFFEAPILLANLHGRLIIKSEGHSVIDPTCYASELSSLQEKYEGMVFVPFVPTSENMSKWIYDIVQKKMKPLNVTVDSVQIYETPKSQSIYSV